MIVGTEWAELTLTTENMGYGNLFYGKGNKTLLKRIQI